MAPAHTVCFCNNRGGVGKTFMAFQTACEAARARPEKKVLVIDFSLYSDQTALLLGGSARESFGAPMKGLQVTVDNTTCDTRAEGLIRDLEHAPDVMDVDERSGKERKPSSSIFGAFFSRQKSPTKTGKSAEAKETAPPRALDLSPYMIRPNDHNPEIPPNLFLVPSAGATSWSQTQREDDDFDEKEVPLWARRGDGWQACAKRLRLAIDALPEPFQAVFIDTDHLAACVLTKLALACCAKTVVPLSFDDGDFNRLFQDVTGNALFTDVMLPMIENGTCRARVFRMVFTKVTSTKNEPVTTDGGIDSPFKPTNTVAAQMDAMASQVQSACHSDRRYAALFDENEDFIAGTNSQFRKKYFTAMKLVPDLAANLSKMCGLPLCAMTSRKYTAPSGLSGQSSKTVLDGLKAEIRNLTTRVLDEMYDGTISAS